MTKFILTFFITFTLLIISNIESKASCASGFTLDTVRMTIGNCDYDVEICYKCALTFPGEVYIKWITQVDSSCNNALPLDQIIQQVRTEISSAQFIYSNLCIDSQYDVPPCAGESAFSEFIIYHAYCMEAERIMYFGEEVLRFRSCDDAVCTEILRYCWNGSSYTKLTSVLDGPHDPSCTLQSHEITIPDYPYGPSECFIINSVPCGIE